MVGRLQQPPVTGVDGGGVFGVFNVVVDHARRCDDVAIVTVIIPFAPATAALLKVDGGVRVELIGRAEGDDGAAAAVVVAEHITVLFTTPRSDLHG